MSQLTVFDRSDVSTKAMLDQLTVASTAHSRQALMTQCGHTINRVLLIDLHPKGRSNMAMPKYGLLIESSLTSFETQDNQQAKLINLEAQLIDELDQNNRITNTYGLYILNSEEFIKMVEAGAYDEPDQFAQKLNNSLVGSTYLQPRYVSLQKTTLDVPGEARTLTLYSADSDREQQNFDAKTVDNTFTFLLNNSLSDLSQDRTMQKAKEDRSRRYAEQVAAAKQVEPTDVRHQVKEIETVDLDALQASLDKLQAKQANTQPSRQKVHKQEVDLTDIPETPITSPAKAESTTSKPSTSLTNGTKAVKGADDPFANNKLPADDDDELVLNDDDLEL